MPEDLSGLNLVELLDLLEPVPSPEPVSLWPQTPLWAWLTAILLLVLVLLAYRRWRRWRQAAYRRAALAEISRAGEDPVRLSEILRRTALCAFPRRSVASLHGDEWLRFLNSTCPGGEFDTEAALVLALAPYEPAARKSIPAGLGALAAFWVRNHRASTEELR